MTLEVIGDGNSDGTQLGSSSSELVGFHGATPTDQDAAITLTSGTLGDSNTAINSILTFLRAKGLIAA